MFINKKQAHTHTPKRNMHAANTWIKFFSKYSIKYSFLNTSHQWHRPRFWRAHSFLTSAMDGVELSKNKTNRNTFVFARYKVAFQGNLTLCKTNLTFISLTPPPTSPRSNKRNSCRSSRFRYYITRYWSVGWVGGGAQAKSVTSSPTSPHNTKESVMKIMGRTRQRQCKFKRNNKAR